MNRAVQGDVVAVEVFPEKDWKAPANEVVDQEGIFNSTLIVEYVAYEDVNQLRSKTTMQKTRTRRPNLSSLLLRSEEFWRRRKNPGALLRSNPQAALLEL